MIAENMYRENCGHQVAYVDADFWDVAERMRKDVTQVLMEVMPNGDTTAQANISS